MNDILLNQIRQIAGSYSHIHRVIIFGSRSRGDYRPKSDIDLAVDSDEDISAFQYDLETKVDTLLKFDVTLLSETLDSAFLEQIRKDGKCIYDRSAI